MTYTVIPSVKGQVTLPADLRSIYKIGKNTPIVIQDEGEGVITLRVMNMVPNNKIEYFENEEEFGLEFKDGVDPQLLIDAINEQNG